MNTLPLWRQILKSNFTKLEPLAEFLQLSDAQKNHLLKKPRFPLNVPLRIAEKIQKGTLDDPLLRQFIPLQEENDIVPGYVSDPVADAQFKFGSKLLHKYHGRVLLVASGACAMHCRFCFRQNFDYEKSNKSFDEELNIIAKDASIHEVILSGGDPLSLSNDSLGALLHDIEEIPHITRIRFHTRFLIGIPERIDREFLDIIASLEKQIWFIIHANHPREFDADIFESLRQLQKLGVVVLCQSVLLKGVNDDSDTLAELCETLVDHGILPYYLHQLDRVEGAAHFEVEESKGLALINEISRRLPGYAVPKYVREIPGEPNKTML